jgi:hypothetical protein
VNGNALFAFGRLSKREGPVGKRGFFFMGHVMVTGGGPVDQEVMRIMSQLTKEGIRVDVLHPDSHTEVFVAELPNRKRYLFKRTGLLKLRDEGKLNIAGIEEFGVMR